MASNLLDQADPVAILGADGKPTNPGTAAAIPAGSELAGKNLLAQAKLLVIVGADGKIHTLDAAAAGAAYTLKAATPTTLGGVKQTAAVADAAADADAAALATTLNALLAALRTAGIIAAK